MAKEKDLEKYLSDNKQMIELYLQELELTCRHVNIAAKGLKNFLKINEDKRGEQEWIIFTYHLESLVNSIGKISNILYPHNPRLDKTSCKKLRKRGEVLRNFLQIGKDSAFHYKNAKALRASVYHYDERVQKNFNNCWLYVLIKETGFISLFKNINLETLELEVDDNRHELVPLIEQANSLYQNIKKFQKIMEKVSYENY